MECCKSQQGTVTKEIEKIAYVYIDKRFFNFLPLERVVSKISKRYLYTVMMSKIVSKLYSSHVLETIPAKKKKKRFQKSTSVVPAKNLSKVKLENFHNSRVLELGKLCVPWFVRVLGFLQQHEFDIRSLAQKIFPCEC